jgi:hypothetical protein
MRLKRWADNNCELAVLICFLVSGVQGISNGASYRMLLQPDIITQALLQAVDIQIISLPMSAVSCLPVLRGILTII